MPSNSFKNFEKYTYKDALRLYEAHEQLKTGTKGKQALGHITRSGIVVLCAAWEYYVEDLTREIALYFSKNLADASKLPQDVKKRWVKHLKEDVHETRLLNLSNDSWREMYVSYVNQYCDKLNTPKPGPIQELYIQAVGWHDVAKNWSHGVDFVKEFVEKRGAVAHKGGATQYPTAGKFNDYLIKIWDTALEHDNAATDYVHSICGARPWNRKYT